MKEYPEHIKYIIDKYSSELLVRLKAESRDITVEGAIDTLLACDSSRGKKLVDWLVKTYCSGGFLWEDVEIGVESKLAEVLGLYQEHFSQIPRDQRNIYTYNSYGELYKLVKPYLPIERVEETLGSREIRRRERAQALEESEVLFRSEDMIVAVPLTQSAAVWWGRGTKWCTAADKDNYFHPYNRKSPLIVITLLNPYSTMNPCSSLDQTSDSTLKNQSFDSSRGVEKVQVWTDGNDIQFMDAQDCEIGLDWIESNWKYLEPIINFLMGWNCEFINYFPKKYLTKEICVRSMLQNKHNIRLIPQEFLNDEICRLAVSRNGEVLMNVPDHLITAEICRLAVENDSLAIFNVPQRFKNFELYRLAVSRNGIIINYLEKGLHTPELFMIAISQNINIFKSVPEHFKTLDFCKAAIEQNGLSIIDIPEMFKTSDMHRLAVESNPLALEFMPDPLKTSELCKKAIEKNGNALEFVPEKFKTADICKRAVEQNPRAIWHVPKILQTFELQKFAVTHKPETISIVHFNIKTAELFEVALKQNGLLLNSIPQKLITAELCNIAIEQNKAALEYVPNHFKTMEMCISCLESNGLMIVHTPQKFLTAELYRIAVEQNPGMISFVPEEFMSDELIQGNRYEKSRVWNKDILLGLQESLNHHNFLNEVQIQPVL